MYGNTNHSSYCSATENGTVPEFIVISVYGLLIMQNSKKNLGFSKPFAQRFGKEIFAKQFVME